VHDDVRRFRSAALDFDLFIPPIKSPMSVSRLIQLRASNADGLLALRWCIGRSGGESAAAAAACTSPSTLGDRARRDPGARGGFLTETKLPEADAACGSPAPWCEHEAGAVAACSSWIGSGGGDGGDEGGGLGERSAARSAVDSCAHGLDWPCHGDMSEPRKLLLL